jgi:hypothetical protein
MTPLLDAATAGKLARICAMFSSNHDGERATAAQMADRIIRARGLTWPDIILPRLGHSSVEEQIDFALRYGDDILNAWEEGFLRGIKGRQFLTAKQLAKLGDIVAKVSARRAGL